MGMQKVPLVAYDEDGVRKVVGECVVDTDGTYIDVTGTVTDPEYRGYIQGPLSGLSLGQYPERTDSDVESQTSEERGSSRAKSKRRRRADRKKQRGGG